MYFCPQAKDFLFFVEKPKPGEHRAAGAVKGETA